MQSNEPCSKQQIIGENVATLEAVFEAKTGQSKKRKISYSHPKLGLDSSLSSFPDTLGLPGGHALGQVGQRMAAASVGPHSGESYLGI